MKEEKRKGEVLLDRMRGLIEDLEAYNVGDARSRDVSVAITNAQTAELWLERSLFARRETAE